VQKEVGERLVAQRATKEYGALTVSVGAVATVEIIADAPRELFRPQPNVDSVVVSIVKTKKDQFSKDAELNNTFKKLVRCAFENRRKILSSNIANAFNISKEKATELIEGIEVGAMIRGEALSVQQFKQLAKSIYKAVATNKNK
ncbi:MAG: 16S rRNA (adenine(1518)-N(6)/adenine(1519)-N(6))-dimethyltransferase, partial [Firmicutes bacterium]|nr:16S rRNA (adenine(1518)-N(6)/adenine(1519)-N(6))-dimethyltransferase [Bacillota bacterium]